MVAVLQIGFSCTTASALEIILKLRFYNFIFEYLRLQVTPFSNDLRTASIALFHEAGRKIVLAMRITAPQKSSITSKPAHEARTVTLEPQRASMVCRELVGDIFNAYKKESPSLRETKLPEFFQVITSCRQDRERFPRLRCQRRPFKAHIDRGETSLSPHKHRRSFNFSRMQDQK